MYMPGYLKKKKKHKIQIQIVNSVHDFCLARGGGSRRMGAKRAMDGAGLSFCLCQQHIGEKNETRGRWKGPQGLRVQGMFCSKGKLSGAKTAGKG